MVNFFSQPCYVLSNCLGSRNQVKAFFYSWKALDSEKSLMMERQLLLINKDILRQNIKRKFCDAFVDHTCAFSVPQFDI